MENKYAELFRNKVVLVAGGTGSIGSEIVRELLKYDVKQVRVFSRDEFKQFNLNQEFSGQPAGRVTFLIGDIRDRDRVFMAMENVNIVFNAAAMKHVSLCEYNPFESIKTNVLGTQNLVDAARAKNVDKFIHISTDKAALPVNVMGATKLLAEKIVISAEHYKGNAKTMFSAVRFGNVLGSRGSVVPIFYQQIRAGGPVTLTDREMTRFIMRIPQAVELVMQASVLSQGEELFILKMPVIRIEDLAKAMIELLGPKYGHAPGKIKIEYIGKRDGEKVYELLLTTDENESLQENNEMLCISNRPLSGFRKSQIKDYRSDNCKCLEYEQVHDFIKQSIVDIEKAI